MPKIYEFRISIGDQHYDVELRYDRRHKFHFGHLPRELLMFSTKELYFLTEKAARHALHQLIQAYELRGQKLEKVILYRPKMTSAVLRKLKDQPASEYDLWAGYKSWVPRSLTSDRIDALLSDDGYGFVIEWRVLLKCKINKRAEYFIPQLGDKPGEQLTRLGHPRYDDPDRSGFFEIPWTALRERALRDIDTAIELLAQRVATVLADPARMIDLLETGGMKLLSAWEAKS